MYLFFLGLHVRGRSAAALINEATGNSVAYSSRCAITKRRRGRPGDTGEDPNSHQSASVGALVMHVEVQPSSGTMPGERAAGKAPPQDRGSHRGGASVSRRSASHAVRQHRRSCKSFGVAARRRIHRDCCSVRQRMSRDIQSVLHVDNIACGLRAVAHSFCTPRRLNAAFGSSSCAVVERASMRASFSAQHV